MYQGVLFRSSTVYVPFISGVFSLKGKFLSGLQVQMPVIP